MYPPTYVLQDISETDSFKPYFIFYFFIERYAEFHLLVIEFPSISKNFYYINCAYIKFNLTKINLYSIVMMLLNLVSLWINLDCYHRLSLQIFNLYLHYTFMNQFFWYIPFNGSTVPNICEFIYQKIIILLHKQLLFFICFF